MEKKTLFIYEAPAVTVYEVRQEGIICQSGGLGGCGGHAGKMLPGWDDFGRLR